MIGGRRATGRRAAGTAALDAVVEQDALVELPGGPLPYVLRRTPRARRLRVTVHPERGVVVSVPAGRGWSRPSGPVEAFLGEREAWIRRHLGRQAAAAAQLAQRPSLEGGREVPYRGVPHRIRVVEAPRGTRTSRVSRVGGETDELLVERSPRERRTTARILEGWFRERAREELDAAIARHAGPLGVAPARITIRDTTSRWGSCSRRGHLSFSWRLVLAPPEALDSVAAHELCHLRVFGHGPRFHALLASRVPDAALWRRWLRRHARHLHAALD